MQTRKSKKRVSFPVHKTLPGLRIKIPLDLAEELGISRSRLCHINAGRRPLPDKCIEILMRLVKTDPRLKGFSILDVQPKLKKLIKLLPYL